MASSLRNETLLAESLAALVESVEPGARIGQLEFNIQQAIDLLDRLYPEGWKDKLWRSNDND